MHGEIGDTYRVRIRDWQAANALLPKAFVKVGRRNKLAQASFDRHLPD